MPGKEASMSAAAKTYITPQQYLEMERQAETKSEYFAGEIFAMSGGTREHSLISGNVIRELGAQLRDRPCEVHTSDMKVRVTVEHYAYPDVTVVCGEAEFADEEND